MKTTVTLNNFRDAFRDCNRADNFSYEGLQALFEHLEQHEEDVDTEMELDVIAFCCDFNECTISEALSYYDYETLEELTDNTLVIFVDDLDNWKDFDLQVDGNKRIIYQAF